MLHPSYQDLIKVVNSEPADAPIIQSRYSIVIAAAKRARQLISGAVPEIPGAGKKPLSVSVEELYEGKVKICGGADDEEEDAASCR